MLELGLLSLLVIIPLAYSTHFSTTLIFKETLAQTTAVFLVAVWLARDIIRGELTYTKTPYNVVISGLMVFALVSLVWVQPKVTSIRDFGLVLSFWMLFHMYCLKMRHRGFRRKAFVCAVAAGCIVAIISLGQLLHWPILENTPFGSVWKHHDPRLKVSSTIGHNISIATFFMALAFIQLGWVLTVRNRRLLVAALPLLALSAIVIFVSETRGVYVAFPLALIFLCVLLLAFRGKESRTGWKVVRQEALRRLLLLALLSGLGFSIIGALLMQGKGTRINPLGRLKTLRPDVLTPGTRVRLWTISTEMIRDYPLRGVGFQSFKFNYPFYQARYFAEHSDTGMVPTEKHTDRVHNEYLQVWVELGVVGLVLILLLILVHLRFVWRQTRNASGEIPKAEDDVFRTVLFAGIGGIMVDTFFHFYAHVASDALMLIFLLSAVIGMSRPLRIRRIRLSGFASRPRLARAMVLCLAVATVALSVFGPRVLAPFIPGERFLGESSGPVAHILADAIYTPEERSLSRQFQQLGFLRMLASNPNEASLTEYCQRLPRFSESIDHFVKAREISGYRGQISFYAGQCLARFAEIQGQLSPLQARVGWQDEAKETREQVVETLRKARFHLHDATEEYQFRHIYYELGKVDYYLAVKSMSRDREKGQQLMDEAEICFRAAAAIYPLNLDYHHDLAKFYLSARKDFRTALDAWKNAFILDRESRNSRLIPEAKAQENARNLELAEWLYRAPYELAKEFLALDKEVQHALDLCRFYSDHGMDSQLEQVVLEINSRHQDRFEAFRPAAHYLASWQRFEKLEGLVLSELEERPLDVPLMERCMLIDFTYQNYSRPDLLVPFWRKVAGHPAEEAVAPHVYSHLGYRWLSVEGNPAASFSALSSVAEKLLSAPPEKTTEVGPTAQDHFFTFLIPIMLR
jgi:O-antigen ligase/tetratricopeptide (TPR) repeat protein